MFYHNNNDNNKANVISEYHDEQTKKGIITSRSIRIKRETYEGDSLSSLWFPLALQERKQTGRLETGYR